MKQTFPFPRSVTMEDVARDAGVSRALVSLVMPRSPKVSPAKRAAVLQSAAALRYSPNRFAGTSQAGAPARWVSFFRPAQFCVRRHRRRHRRGHRRQRKPAPGRRRLRGSPGRTGGGQIIRGPARVDGVLLAGYTGSAEELATALRGTPAVVTTRELEADGVDAVLTDDFRSAGLAVEHLHGPGHRKIAHLDISDWLPYTARREGYLHAMVQFLGSGGRLPTAIFAHNDLTAIGVMEALQAHGLDVPDDMAVVGCDNIEVAASPLIGLTSVDQHARRLGRMAARVMLDRLGGAGGAAVTRKLAPELLLVRRSSGPPAGG